MADDDSDETPRGFEQHLRVYFRDPGLWPILAVVVLIAGTLGASLIVYALELRNLFPLAALTILIVASGHALVGEVRERRIGAASCSVAIFWLASGGIALAARMAGVF